MLGAWVQSLVGLQEKLHGQKIKKNLKHKKYLIKDIKSVKLKMYITFKMYFLALSTKTSLEPSTNYTDNAKRTQEPI